MENNRLEIPGNQVFLKDGRLGYKENTDTDDSTFISDPDVVRLSELKEALISLNWLCDDRDVYDPHIGVLCRKKVRTLSDVGEQKMIPNYVVSSNKFISLENKKLQGPKKNQGDLDDLNRYLSELSDYTQLFNKYIMIKEDNIGEYTNIISSRDILEGTSEICLLCPKDGSYTNIINLNSIQGDLIQLRVGVAYSKGSNLFSKDLVVSTEGSKDSCYIITGPREFKLEYSDGCIRVFPDAPEVTECVISYCYLTYEHLI